MRHFGTRTDQSHQSTQQGVFFFFLLHAYVMEHRPGWTVCTQHNATGVLISMRGHAAQLTDCEHLNVTIKSRITLWLLWQEKCTCGVNEHFADTFCKHRAAWQVSEAINPLMWSDCNCRSMGNRGTNKEKEPRTAVFLTSSLLARRHRQ